MSAQPEQTPPPPPLPNITALEEPYFAGLREGRLMLQRCGKCGHVWFPPSPLCPECLDTEPVWEEMSGRGTVWSHIVMHQPYFAAFRHELPYNVVFVQLEEGPYMISRIVDMPNDAIECGMKVQSVFREVTDGVVLPYFTAAG